jgi:hypothetical protein
MQCISAATNLVVAQFTSYHINEMTEKPRALSRKLDTVFSAACRYMCLVSLAVLIRFGEDGLLPWNSIYSMNDSRVDNLASDPPEL